MDATSLCLRTLRELSLKLQHSSVPTENYGGELDLEI